ncbi:winged helix family two component heavy metal response transcriptional regulator [Sphaerotilus hippei]|uniref:Winged helix family two component heavy metal response transcriptional regulator n=1 Tax=Sphaerotilus hippei TaxID=744406 RepID=A0A318GX26_9BURK|nr:heavy metal response regulator transcription factor [Sphaerotilus hippei]PXW94325.1 winged helix family two component heavy metal response transcriptional regulator [Sphaerotilus hippei]
MKLLVIDDDARALNYLGRGLREQGFMVDTAADGLEGLHLASTGDYDVIVLDGMLPGLDGLQVLQQLRRTHQTPVIMLTARDGVADRVQGLQQGADDYLVKPFSFTELVARLQALVRRAAPREAGPLVLGDLSLDPVSCQASRAGQRIALTAKEFLLLATLLRRRGQVLSKTVLAELVWDIHFDSDLNVVEAAIKRLRAKIDDGHAQRLLHTVRGMGYVLECRDEPS